MAKELIISIRITVILLLITCAAYPAVVWAISQAAFHRQANGSLVTDAKGNVVGSELLAQAFTKDQYFQPRPSAAGSGYDSSQSSGTNLGPTSDKLINGVHKPAQKNGQPDPSDFDGIKDLAREYRQTNGLPPTALVPIDAVTRSGSGLDPHISPMNANLQAARVAKARGITVDQVMQIVHQNTVGRGLGFLGEPAVNVLDTNLALDKQYPVPAAPAAASPAHT
jgi:K+-transporting ATPase ATPase C chain